MECKFRQAAMAWMTLSDKGANELYILWDGKRDRTIVQSGEKDGLYYNIFADGVVEYGYKDKNGKWWSSSDGVINSSFSVDDNSFPAPEVIDVHSFEPADGGICRASAITKEFCEKILQDFSLQFHLVKREYGNRNGDTNYKRYIFEQLDRDKLQHEIVQDKTGKKFRIIGPTWTGLFNDIEGYTVVPAGDWMRTRGNIPVVKDYKNLPYIYQGTDWNIIMAFVHGWFHDTTCNGR